MKKRFEIRYVTPRMQYQDEYYTIWDNLTDKQIPGIRQGYGGWQDRKPLEPLCDLLNDLYEGQARDSNETTDIR